MENKFVPLDMENDVVSGISEELFNRQVTFVVNEFFQAIEEIFNPREEEAELFGDGIDCKILKPGKGWQKGKIRLTLEFIPDQPIIPPSPLDDLRKQIKQ